MADDPFTPRHRYADASERHRVLRKAIARARSVLDMIRNEPGRLEQIRYASLSGEYRSIALESYLLGRPLDQVRVALASAALAGLRVTELRGTEPVFPVVTVTLDPENPGRALKETPPDNQKRDYSLGN